MLVVAHHTYLKIVGITCMVVYKQYDLESWTESVTDLVPHWVTELAPPDEDHNVFTGNLCCLGTITLSTIFWTFMAIHNSRQSHYQIIWLVTCKHFVLLKKVSFPL